MKIVETNTVLENGKETRHFLITFSSTEVVDEGYCKLSFRAIPTGEIGVVAGISFPITTKPAALEFTEFFTPIFGAGLITPYSFNLYNKTIIQKKVTNGAGLTPADFSNFNETRQNSEHFMRLVRDKNGVRRIELETRTYSNYTGRETCRWGIMTGYTLTAACFSVEII